MEFTCELDAEAIKRLKDAANRWGPKVVQRAPRDAVSRSVTTLKREVTARYNISGKDLEKLILRSLSC